MSATTMGGTPLISYVLEIESIALDTVKTLVAMGRMVWCERVENGWRITTEEMRS